MDSSTFTAAKSQLADNSQFLDYQKSGNRPPPSANSAGEEPKINPILLELAGNSGILCVDGWLRNRRLAEIRRSSFDDVGSDTNRDYCHCRLIFNTLELTIAAIWKWETLEIYVSLGIILAGVIGLSVWLIKVYNTLTVLKNEVVNSWAQVETDYQFRLDLIPGLVKAVKGYAKHESETLEAVIRARSAAVSADGIEAKQSANEQLDTTLGRLLLLVESYPSLQANSNFLQFQNQLEGVEKRISLARRLFNENVRVYNTSQQVFPANLVSRRFGHEDASQFKAQPEAAKTPQFDF